MNTNVEMQNAAAPDAPAGRPRPSGVNLVVLSADPALIDQLREALAGSHRVWRADDATHAADLVVAAGNASLLVDAGLADTDSTTLILKLHEQFPDLPIIVAGRRNDETELAGLVSSGAIFRFLHKPASIERIKNFVDASQRRTESRPVDAAEPRTAMLPMPNITLPEISTPLAKMDPAKVQTFAIRGLMVVAALAAIYLLASYQPWKNLGSDAVETVAAPMAPQGSSDPQVIALLTAADAALAESRLVDPPENSAVWLYRSVLAREPANTRAREGLNQSADRLLENAEKATVDGDLAALASALDGARSARPDHPRLAFFSGQLEQERERAEIARRRGPQPGGATAPEDPAAVAARAARVNTLVNTANDRMTKNRLTEGKDSALAHLIEARRVDANDPAVTQAAATLSTLLQLRTREAVSAGKMDEAGTLLQHAASLGVDTARVAALRAEVESTRQSGVREQRAQLLVHANQRIAQGQILEPAADSAQHYLSQLRAAEPNYPGLADTTALMAAKAVEQARRLLADNRLPAAEAMVAAAIAAGAAKSDTDRVTGDIAARRTAAATPPPPSVLREDQLNRVGYSAPRYPPRALSRSIQGWVDLEFTVKADGTTTDISVIDGRPKEVFDDSAVNAIEKWRYVPHVVNGKVVDQRVALRMKFALAD